MHQDWMDAHSDCSADELVNEYVMSNAEWINEEAEGILRSLELDQLWRIIEFGSLHGVRDPVAIIKCRIRDAQAGKGGKSKGKGKKGEVRAESSGASGQNAEAECLPFSFYIIALKAKPPGPRRTLHQEALREERSMLVTGVPAIWTTERTQEFFEIHGQVASVLLCPRRNEILVVSLRGKLAADGKSRAVSIDFDTSDAAQHTVLATDQHTPQQFGRQAAGFFHPGLKFTKLEKYSG